MLNLGKLLSTRTLEILGRRCQVKLTLLAADVPKMGRFVIDPLQSYFNQKSEPTVHLSIGY